MKKSLNGKAEVKAVVGEIDEQLKVKGPGYKVKGTNVERVQEQELEKNEKEQKSLED